jgi:hypothetical protein
MELERSLGVKGCAGGRRKEGGRTERQGWNILDGRLSGHGAAAIPWHVATAANAVQHQVSNCGQAYLLGGQFGVLSIARKTPRISHRDVANASDCSTQTAASVSWFVRIGEER